MRDGRKRPEDELLVVHKPAPAPDKTGREPAATNLQMLPADVNALADRILESTDPETRARLLAAIQGRFSNGFAARVMDQVRFRQQAGETVAPGKGSPGDALP